MTTEPQAAVAVSMEPTDLEGAPPEATVNVVPMPPIPGRSLTITFERTVRPADYESKRVGATSSFELPADFPLDRISELVEDEFMMVASAIYQQLGIAFTRDEASRVLVEAFPGSAVAQAPAQAPAQAAFAGTAFTPPPTMAPAAAPAAAPFAAPAPAFGGSALPKGPALWDHLLANSAEWNDVRGTKTSDKSPDFKHTTAKNEKGQDVALWIVSQWNPAPPHVRQALGLG